MSGSGHDADLVVAGGGPVGLAAAIAARAGGLSVVVVEPRQGAVDKACGEGLMPSAVRQLAALGVDPVGRDFVGIRYVHDGRWVDAAFRKGPGRGVRRTTLHDAFTARARQVGVQWQNATVTTVEQDAGGVVAAGLRGRWLVGADGLHSAVRRAAGLELPPGTGAGPVRFGLRRHFRISPWADHVEVHWASSCEAYVTPVAEDLVGVAVLGGRGAGFEDALAHLPGLQARLRRAEPATAVRGAGPLRQRPSDVRRGRVLLVGDAAGYVDALTGEGIAVGVATARAAVAALGAGRPQDYPAAWRRVSRRYRLVTEGLLAVSGDHRARAALVPAATRWPGVFRRVVELAS